MQKQPDIDIRNIRQGLTIQIVPTGTAEMADGCVLMRVIIRLIAMPGYVLIANGIYVDKNGYMVTDAWIDDYYVHGNGVMKTGWVNEGEDNLFYFYSDGTKAVNTTIDGYILGIDDKWDKNPEFTQEIAVNLAKQKYSDDSTEAICGGFFIIFNIYK